MTPTEEVIVVCVGALVGALAGYRLDLGKSRTLKLEADIKADKLRIIPLLDGTIEDVTYQNQPPYFFKMDCVEGVKDLYLRFRLHLKGRHLKAVDAAWRQLEQTTEAELTGKTRTGMYGENQWMHEPDELRGVQQILISRLEAFRESVHDT